MQMKYIFSLLFFNKDISVTNKDILAGVLLFEQGYLSNQ